jgi:hypothetical protein
MTDVLNFYLRRRNTLQDTRQFKGYGFNITAYFNDNCNININNLKNIVKYFRNYILKNTEIINIHILNIDDEKIIHTKWNKFLSGFYIRDKIPKTVYISRTIEWERTLIHELVHCCLNEFNEIETEVKTIEIYNKLFGISETQYDHSLQIFSLLIQKFDNNLLKYIFAYLQKSTNKCQCDFTNSFRYLCKNTNNV